MANCTEMQQAIHDMAMNIGSRPGIETLDDVVAEIRKDFPILQREHIVEAIKDATSRKIQHVNALKKKLNEIKRNARMEVAGLAKVDQVLEYLDTGKLPDAPKPRKMASETLQQIRKTLANVRKWLKTADPAMQKTMQTKLDALNQQIEAGDVILEEKREGELHETLQGLEEQIKAAQKKIADEKTIKALEAKVAELQGHLDAGTLPEVKARAAKGTGPADILRDIVADLRRQIARSEPAQMARLEKQKADLEALIASGDIMPAPKPERVSSKALDQQQYQVDLLRNRIREMRLEAQPKTAGQHFRKWMQLTIPIKAGQDFSQVMNQGGRYFFAHPIKSAQAFVETLKAMADPVQAAKINRDMVNHPLMPIFYQAGYRLSAVTGVSLGPQEEAYWGSVLERLPVIKQFARGFSTYLNVIRFGSMVDFAENWTLTGDPTLEEAKMIVKGVNQFTGRGTLGKRDTAGPFLETVMWAPRLVTSHVQTLFAFPLWQTSGAARSYFAHQYARWLGGVAAFLFLGWLDGWEIDWSGTSSNVLGLRKGNVTLNPLGGVSTVITLIARHVYGVSTNAITGKETALRGPKVQWGYQTLKDIEFNFLDYKVHPGIKNPVEYIRQEKFGVKPGEPVTIPGQLWDAVENITWRQIYDINAKSELGIPDAAMASLLAMLGMKVNVYDDKKTKGARR